MAIATARMRPSRSGGARSCREINDARAAGGNLLVPAFAVERTQELLHDIGVLMAERQIKDLPVFLDSPLANNATRVFTKHAGALEDVALDESELFRNPNFRFVESVEESKSLNGITAGAIIIAASGMCDAGRIRHHLKNNLWRPQATVLFVGYQAPGTLGRLILDGVKSVRMFDEEVRVEARIREIGNYSAHADQKELVAWVVERLPVAGGIFLTHGEDPARAALREHLIAAGCAPSLIHLPKLDDGFALVAAAAPVPAPTRPASRRARSRATGTTTTPSCCSISRANSSSCRATRRAATCYAGCMPSCRHSVIIRKSAHEESPPSRPADARRRPRRRDPYPNPAPITRDGIRALLDDAFHGRRPAV